MGRACGGVWAREGHGTDRECAGLLSSGVRANKRGACWVRADRPSVSLLRTGEWRRKGWTHLSHRL